LATAADRLYEIAFDAIAQQRAEVERARGLVVPVSAAALAIAAALVKPAFNARGSWHTTAAVLGSVGAFGVLLISVLILLEPKETKLGGRENQPRPGESRQSRMPGLTLKFDVDALSKNPGLTAVMEDETLSQIVLATYLSRIRSKNEPRLRNLRHLCTSLLGALVLEAGGFVAAAVVPAFATPRCHRGDKPCARSRRSSGLQVTVLRVDVGGIVQLRGRVDNEAAGTLRVVIAFIGGRNGRTVRDVRIVAGRFSARAAPSRRPASTCEASYRVAYPGSATLAPAAVSGRSIVACKQTVEDAT
jgi:hypothetical protein